MAPSLDLADPLPHLVHCTPALDASLFQATNIRFVGTGFSVVKRGVDKKLGMPVAIKVCRCIMAVALGRGYCCAPSCVIMFGPAL